MADNFSSIKKWGCLYILCCIGLSSFIAFIFTSMANNSPANKWIFLIITIGCIIWAIKRYSSSAQKGVCTAKCPYCKSIYEICCGKCGGLNLSPVFMDDQIDMYHIVGLKCGTGPRLEGGCGFSMGAVTCPQCKNEIPISEIEIEYQRHDGKSCGCLIVALVVVVGFILLLMTYSYLMHKAGHL